MSETGGPSGPGHPGDQPWDPGLQNERTRLAWQRTVLSTTACSLVIARLVGITSWQLGVVIALGALVTGLLLARQVVGRYQVSHRALHAGRRLPGARAHAGMTWLMLLAAVGAMTYLLLDWFG